jgi:hypothetical protein
MRLEVDSLPGWVFDLPEGWTPQIHPLAAGAAFAAEGETRPIVCFAFDEPLPPQFVGPPTKEDSAMFTSLFHNGSEGRWHSLVAVDDLLGSSILSEQVYLTYEDRLVTITVTAAIEDYVGRSRDIQQLLRPPERVDPLQPAEDTPIDTPGFGQ